MWIPDSWLLNSDSGVLIRAGALIFVFADRTIVYTG